jgi:hypothetical protein
MFSTMIAVQTCLNFRKMGFLPSDMMHNNTISKKIILSILLILVEMSNLNLGCGLTSDTTNSTNIDNIKYISYQMNENDVRLKFLHHPLFTFEYPDKFLLVDVNKMPDYPMTYNISDTEFTYKQYIPEQVLWIRIEKSGLFTENAYEKIQNYVSLAEKQGDSYSQKTQTVDGISAEYFESQHFGIFLHTETDLIRGYTTIRKVVFDYSGMIWEIALVWNYIDTEPPGVQEYFNNIIGKFKILDSSP